MRTRVRKKDSKESYSIYRPFRNCNANDFITRNYIENTNLFTNDAQKYLCPDIFETDDFYNIESTYTNTTYRSSVSVEIHLCNK